MTHALLLIPAPLRPHLACATAVVAASAVGLLAEHMAGPMLAFPLAALLAKMAGELIGRTWA